MSRPVVPIVALALASVMPAAQNADAAPVLDAARQALGGDAALNAVTSFSVEGRDTISIANASLEVTIVQEVTISCVLPSKYLRQTTTELEGADLIQRRRFGFNGDDPIAVTDSPIPLPPEPGALPDPAAERARLLGIRKRDFARLMIALFAASPEAYPLTFASVGPDAAYPRFTEVIRASSPDGTTFDVAIDPDTHLPAAVSWREVDVAPPGVGSGVRPARPGARQVPVEIIGPTTAAAEGTVDYRLVFSGHKANNGLMWPSRIRHYRAGKEAMGTELRRFTINPKISDRTFAVPKGK